MKKFSLFLLLSLFYVFAQSSQVNYDGIRIVTWLDLVGLNYTVIFQDTENESSLVELFGGEVVIINWG